MGTKAAKISLNTPTPISPGEGYNPRAEKTKVVAGRIDAYSDPGPWKGNEGDLNAIATFVNGVNSGVTSYGTIQKINTLEGIEEGALLHAQGVKREDIEDKGAAVIKGFELRQGKADAIRELYANMDKFYEENKALLPEEFSKKFADTVSKDYLNGKSKYYAAGFSDVASEVEKHLLLKHGQYIQSSVNEENWANIGTVMRSDVLNLFQNSTGLGITDLMNSKSARLAWDQRKVTDGPKLSADVRQYVTDEIARLKTTGIPAKEAGAYAARTILHMAEEYGMPELIKYATIPDKNGIAVISNPSLQGEITASIVSAENKHKAILNYLENKEKEQKDKDKHTMSNKFLVSIMNSSTADQFSVIENSLRDPTTMEALNDHFPSLYKMAMDGMRTGSSFAQITDGATWKYIMGKGRSLSLQDVMENSKSLSKTDFDHAIAMVNSNTNFATNLDLENNYRMFSSLSSAVGSTVKRDPLGNILNPQGYSDMMDMLWREVQEYQRKNGMRYPVGDDFGKIKKNLLENFGSVLGQDNKETPPPVKPVDKETKKAAEPNKPEATKFVYENGKLVKKSK